MPPKAATDSAGGGGTEAALEVLPAGEDFPWGQDEQASEVVPAFELYSFAGQVKGGVALQKPLMQEGVF